MHRRTFTSALLLCLTSISATISHADTLDDILKNKVLRVAVPQDFPPFGSLGADTTPTGYDIDFAKLLAQEMGVAVALVPVTSADRIPYLNAKKVDLVVSTLGKNPEREKLVDFSDAYAPFFSGVFGSEGLTVSKAEDLAGKTIGVTKGAIEDLELTKLAPPTATIKRLANNNATIAAYLSGQVPLIATGNVIAGNVSEKHATKRLDFKFMIKNSPCYVGLNKNEARLHEKVNAIIAKSKTDGTLNAIAQKWLKLKRPVSTFLQ